MPDFQSGDRLAALPQLRRGLRAQDLAAKPGYLAVAVSSRYADRAPRARSWATSSRSSSRTSSLRGGARAVPACTSRPRVHEGARRRAQPSRAPTARAAGRDAQPRPVRLRGVPLRGEPVPRGHRRSGVSPRGHAVPRARLVRDARDHARDPPWIRRRAGDDVSAAAHRAPHPGRARGNALSRLTDILNAPNNGDLHATTPCASRTHALNAQPALVAHERKLREKITILCLLQIVPRPRGRARNRASDDRRPHEAHGMWSSRSAALSARRSRASSTRWRGR